MRTGTGYYTAQRPTKRAVAFWAWALPARLLPLYRVYRRRGSPADPFIRCYTSTTLSPPDLPTVRAAMTDRHGLFWDSRVTLLPADSVFTYYRNIRG